MAKRDPMLNEHLKTADRNAQYTSKTVQNEVIDLVKRQRPLSKVIHSLPSLQMNVFTAT